MKAVFWIKKNSREVDQLICQDQGVVRPIVSPERPGGRDQIIHFPNAHDDLAVVLAGAVYQASRKQLERHFYWI
jgi:hypothetical protein